MFWHATNNKLNTPIRPVGTSGTNPQTQYMGAPYTVLLPVVIYSREVFRGIFWFCQIGTAQRETPVHISRTMVTHKNRDGAGTVLPSYTLARF